MAAADPHSVYFLRVLNNALAGPKSCKHYKALVCILPGSEPLSPGLLVDWTGPDRRAPRQFVSSPRSVFIYARRVYYILSHILHQMQDTLFLTALFCSSIRYCLTYVRTVILNMIGKSVD